MHGPGIQPKYFRLPPATLLSPFKPYLTAVAQTSTTLYSLAYRSCGLLKRLSHIFINSKQVTVPIMGGDLNAKKSWHVSLLSNQRKVWEQEQAALAERKKTADRLEELRKERQEEELLKLEAAAGGKVPRVDRGLAWMYQGPNDNGNGMSVESSEAFLLGKRRIDSLIKGDDHKKLEKQAGEDSFMALTNANTVRDTASKIRDDPLLAIKKQEQASYEAAMNDPLKRRQLLASMGIADPSEKKKEEKRHKRRHHHRHRHHDDRSDDERRYKRRRSDSQDRSRSPRRYHSDEEDRYRSRRRDSKERERRRHERDQDEHDSRSRRRDYDGRDEHESRSRRRDHEDQDHDKHDSKSRRRDYDEHSDEERRYKRRRSSSRDEKREQGRGDRRNERRDDSYRRPNHNGNYNGRQRNGARPQNGSDDKAADEERARKLAAMQDAASDLDKDRERRLAEIDEREKAAREADDKARREESKYGGGRSFANGFHRKAGDMGLAERIGRGRHGLQRDDD